MSDKMVWIWMAGTSHCLRHMCIWCGATKTAQGKRSKAEAAIHSKSNRIQTDVQMTTKQEESVERHGGNTLTPNQIVFVKWLFENIEQTTIAIYLRWLTFKLKLYEIGCLETFFGILLAFNSLLSARCFVSAIASDAFDILAFIPTTCTCAHTQPASPKPIQFIRIPYSP